MRAPSSLYSKAAGAQPLERRLDVVRRARQHRRDRRQQPQREPREAGGALLERRARDLADVARVHRGLAHVRGRQPAARAIASSTTPSSAPWRSSPTNSSTRNRRSSARGAREQRAQGAAPPVRRTRRPLSPAIASHVGPRRAGCSGSPSAGALGHGRLERPPAEPDPALGQRPRQVQGGQLGLAPARPAAGDRPAAPTFSSLREVARTRATHSTSAESSIAAQDIARC